ncbi:3'-5' exonuclease [Parafrankia sp. FMc6]|uniref:3'-5' exonuclease n=1 Tax=Parafrankia soli TaxID=2599596 RepID=UPI0034D4C5DB
MIPIASLVAQAASAISGRPGTVLVVADGPDRPDLLLIDQRAGLYAIDINPVGTTPDDRRPWVALNRKRAELRETLSGLGEPAVGAAIVLGAVNGRLLDSSRPLTDRAVPTGRTVLSPLDITDPGWPDRLPQRAITDADFSAIVDHLAPSVVFSAQARPGAVDPGAASRAATRIQLDAAQAATALAPISDVAVVTGPPGSGKTLLLAARARELRRVHPDWRLTILVYNRALVPYLTRLVNDPAVTVTTVGKFAHQLGFRMDLRGGEQTERDFQQARERGIPLALDALLVDELQDFDPAWLRFALATVHPGRGGALLVGDQAQGLYRDGDPSTDLSGHDVVRYTLTRPYRSTRQVLRAAGEVTGHPVAGIASAPEGEPVDLIWADSRDAQVECVAWEISSLLADGQRRPHEIAVLITQWRGLSRLRAALTNAGVPFEVFDKKDVMGFDCTTPTVKLITVHSGKGYEFPVVFLVGLENLPTGHDEPTRQRERIGFVGATRAQDQLLITYTKSTAHVDRLAALGPDVRCWTWPDDYRNSDSAEAS